MSDAITNPSDLFIPELAQEYMGYEFRDSLGVLEGLVGPGPDAPVRLVNFGFLQHGGVYVQGPRFKPVADLVTRRDNASAPNAAVETKKLEARNDRGVLVNLKIGPVAFTKDSTFLAGLPEGTLEREFAAQAAQATRYALQSHILHAAYGVLSALTGASHTVSVWAGTGTKATLSTALLAKGLLKLADRPDLITAWVMRSESHYDLVAAQLAAGIAGITEQVAAGGPPHTLGRKLVVVDHPALTAADEGFHKYRTLGVGPGLLEVEFVRPPLFYPARLETQEETVKVILRGDLDIAIRAPGLQWDAANGGANPTQANLATGDNWDPIYSDHREVPGVLLEHNYSGN